MMNIFELNFPPSRRQRHHLRPNFPIATPLQPDELALHEKLLEIAGSLPLAAENFYG